MSRTASWLTQTIKSGRLFDWYSNGDVEVSGSDPITNGWNGNPAVGEAVFVVTHEPPTNWPFPDAPFTFVTDGVMPETTSDQLSPDYS
jgi:hypothetical protein